MSDFAKDSLTLEETNQLRAKLGLKPLVDDGPSSKDEGKQDKQSSVLDNQEERANENYEKRREKERAEREEKEARERIAKAQNKRELAKKLRGPTLGDAEPSSLGSSSNGSSNGSSSKDTLKWLKTRQKREKAHAAARLAELEAQEAQESQAVASYDAKDLTGLKVGHALDSFDFQDGEERVLTLKDSKILGDDEDEDELMDSSLHQSELDRQNLERKKGVKNYTGLDDDEFEQDGIQAGKKKGVLAKYDADIKESEREKKEREDKGFTLGAPTRTKEEEVKKKQEETARMLNRTMLSLDYTKNQEASDYLTEGEVGFKKSKSKKKKKKATKVKLEADDDEEMAGPSNSSVQNQQEDSEMKDANPAQDSVSAPSRRRIQETDNFVDDDELAASLARARRQKAKKTFAKMTPEMIAQNLKAQQEAEAAEAAEKEREASHSNLESAPAVKREGSTELLTFDATSEFVRNISNRPVEEPRRVKRSSQSATPGPSGPGPTEVDVKIKEEPQSPGAVDAEMLIRPSVEEEGEEEDYEQGPPPDLEAKPPTQEEEEVEVSNATGSLAGTLALLRNQGLMTSITPEQKAREKEQMKYDAWLATRRAEDAAREAERVASKAQGSAKDQATREWENKQRELEDARRAIEKFKDYKPDIEIKYHDSYGRTLNHREAWKHLSHEFHGKGHGHKMQEKIRKRIELEKKQEKMFAGDLKGMGSSFTERAERMGQAHMVLSVGARGNAPQDIGMLGPNTVKKGSNANSKPKGASSNGEASSSRTTLANRSSTPSGLDSWLGGIQSGTATGTGTNSTVAATGKRAGFAPVKSSPVPISASNSQEGRSDGKADADGSGNANGNTASRFKLTFGTKRENPDSDHDQPPHKKRA